MLWMLFRADGWFVLSFMVEGLTYWCGIEDGHYYSKKGEFSSRTSMVDIDFESTIDGDDNEGELNYIGNCTTVHVSRRVSIFPSLSGLTGSWTQVRVVLGWRRVRLCCRLSKEKKKKLCRQLPYALNVKWPHNFGYKSYFHIKQLKIKICFLYIDFFFFWLKMWHYEKMEETYCRGNLEYDPPWLCKA